MLENLFSDVYSKFKVNFYTRVLSRFESRETSLTTVEVFCLEIIHLLGKPTINEFASFTQISSPNAAYKITNLVKKGYIKKTRSKEDKREYYLSVTDKYYDYYNIGSSYVHTVVGRMKERFTKEELDLLERMLEVISNELMPEMTKVRS